MKRTLVILLPLVLAVFTGQVAAATVIDDHLNREGEYWLKGTPNDHQRYSAICGVFRQDTENRQMAVVYVNKWDVNKNEITGTPVGNKTVVEITTDDMDYVYGALAISRLCGMIPQVLVDETSKALQGNQEDFPARLLQELGLDAPLTIEE